MYTDYNIEDILETISKFVADLDNLSQKFNERADYFEKRYFHCVDLISRNKTLQSAAKKQIDYEVVKQKESIKTLKQNETYLKEKQSHICKLNEVKLTKEKELLELEKELAGLIKSQKLISRKKDEILTYKLLTNTSFDYSSQKVRGIVLHDNPKTFSYDPREISRKEITQNLWELINDKKV